MTSLGGQSSSYSMAVTEDSRVLGATAKGTQPSSELLVGDIFMTCSFEVNHAGMLSRAFPLEKRVLPLGKFGLRDTCLDL